MMDARGVFKRKSQEIKKKSVYSRWYTQNLRSLIGHNWAMFFAILGGRMTGKSYALEDHMLNKHRKLRDKVKLYWLRISETSTKALLANKASDLFDPDLVRKYKLQLTVKGSDVYNAGKKLITVLPLSKMGKLKGVGFYDKDYKGEYIIVLDEFQLEEGEKKTSFDLLYNFIGTIENLVRSTKTRIRIFLVGNTLEEASTILKAFDFIPEAFGRFYLKRKRCIVDNIEPTEEYLNDRKGSAADILGGGEMSNYTNQLRKDVALIDKARRRKPQYLIRFGTKDSDAYLVWERNVITKYKGQPITHKVTMRPYIDGVFDPNQRQMVIDMFDARAYKFDTLITLSYFQDALKKIRKGC